MRLKNRFKWLVLIGVPIIKWQCYWYVGFNLEITKLLNFIVSFILLVFVGGFLLKNKTKGYDRYVKWMVIIFLISLITSFIYWEQSPTLTFRAGVSFLTLLYYFILKKYKVTEDELFKLVFVFAGIYVLLWLYALTKAPAVVFGSFEELDNNRGFYRILQLSSLDTVCLSFFISLSQSITQNKNRIKWIVLSVCSFLVIFLALSRMMVFSILIVSVLFILRKRFVLAVVIAGLLVFGYNQLVQNKIVSEMINLTDKEINSRQEGGLRMVEYKNVFSAYPFHIGTTLFGNGAPHVLSSYGKYNEYLKSSLKFNLSDAGYVGVYVEYGIAMLIVLFFLLVNVVKTPIPIQYQPYRMFIISLFIVCITKYAFWSYGISFAISLYALSLSDSPPQAITAEHS